ACLPPWSHVDVLRDRACRSTIPTPECHARIRQDPDRRGWTFLLHAHVRSQRERYLLSARSLHTSRPGEPYFRTWIRYAARGSSPDCDDVNVDQVPEKAN